MPTSYASPPDDTSLIRKMGPNSEHAARDFKGTPLFEFLSVKVGCHNFKDVDAASGYTFPLLEIYGQIELIDEYKKFSLFRRKKSEAKAVFIHNPSSSSNPTNPSTTILNNFDIEGPRCMCPKFRLKFCLKDRLRNVTIFDDYKDVDCTRPVLYDKVQSYWFDTTPELSVSFDFVLLRCALVANVSIILDKKERSLENVITHAQSRGTITSATKMSDLSSIQRLLFDGSEKLVFGMLNNLASFAVPSYSFLEFEVNLEVNGDKITCLSKFEPTDWFQIPYEDELYGESYHIRLIVDWGLGERFLPEYLSSELQYDTYKKRKLVCKQQHPLYRYVSDIRHAYMEIFSVSICFYGVDGCKGLYGKIEASDEDEDFVLFDGALGYHKSNETINLKGPRHSYHGDYFLIDVDLKDGEGREISFGCVGYDFFNKHVYYNMRMCSIIRGKHGFAALHYTIFADAIQSKLKFTLEPVTLCDNVKYEVYGKISASYSSYKYSTHYQKKYYQSMLFKKGKGEAVKLGVIPLSQSVVAVPLNGGTSLIVSAKLHVLLKGSHIETVQYMQTFNPRTCSKKTHDVSTSKDFRFQASVKWTSFNI